jgi:endonuclease YncB( thermonuclease family)
MMKKIILTMLLMYATVVFSNPYKWQITRIIDGDTVVFNAPWLPDPLKKELSIRIYGVDTPEKGFRAKCPEEDLKGREASKFTQRQLSKAKEYLIVLREWDKYGGRVLGDIIIDGKSLRELLISNGHAREYYGEAKQSWCN